MPNILVVLIYRTVRGEEACFCNIHKHLPGPCGTVLILAEGLFLFCNIALQIQQRHEPVFMGHILIEPRQIFRIPQPHHLRANDKIDQSGNFRVGRIEVPRMVGLLFIERYHLFAGLSKDIDVLLANQVVNFHIGSVHSPQGHCAVEHELHVSGTAGLFGRQRNLL